MIDDFLDNILDYSKVEYYYIRLTGDYNVNITDKIVDGEFTYEFTWNNKLPISGNLDFGYYYLIPDRYYSFYAYLVKDNSKEMTNWQSDMFDGSDVVWVTTLPTAPMKLLDDAGAPEISDIMNTSGLVSVDNSSVISVNATDDQLIKEVVIEYRVNGGSWLKCDSDTYRHNGAYALNTYETEKISSVTASVNVSWMRYNNKGDYNTDWRDYDLQNGDTLEIVAYVIDNHGNKSVVKTATYTYVKIDPPTGLNVTAGNACATVSWDKSELPEGVVAGTPEYGYRVYSYKTSNNSLFSETDVLPGVTSAVIPLDVVRYTGDYYFKVSVLTYTGGLGDKTDNSANITPLEDITPPTGTFVSENTTTLAGTNTDGKINFKVDSLDNNYVKTLLVNVVDESGNVYATWIYNTETGYYWGGYNYYYSNGYIGVPCGASGNINTLDLGDLAGEAALTDSYGKKYIPDGIYRLTLTVTDFSDLTAYCENEITVDNLAPDITGGNISANVSVKGPDTNYSYERLVSDVVWSIPEVGEALSKVEVRRYEFSELANAENLYNDVATYASQYYYNVISTDTSARSVENGLSSGRYYVYVLSAIDIAGNRSDFIASDIVFAGVPKYSISVLVNGSNEYTSIKLGDKLTFTVTSSVAKQGVVLRLYRVINNSTRWFAEGKFGADGTARIEYTIPATDSGWIGTQYFYAEYYYNANFGSDIKEFEIGLKLITPEYVNSSSEVGKISIRWGNVPNSDKYRIYRSTATDGIVSAGNLIAETTSRSYNDILADVGVKYYYAVVAVANAFGQEITSAPTVTETAVSMIRDDSAPTIYSVTPKEKALIAETQKFNISAYDNVLVSSVIVEWKSYDDINAIYAELYNGAFNGTDVTVDFSKVRAGASQNIFVRFRVLDPTGNKSEWRTNVYAIGDTLSAPTSLLAEPGERKIALGWQSVLRLDVTGYRIYRAVGTDAYEFLADIISGESVYVDEELDPTSTYKYKVCAVAGETEGEFSKEVTALPGEQKTPPTVIYLDPLRSSSFNGDLTLTAVASDRIAIKRFTFEYAYLGISSALEPNEDLTWQPAAIVTEGIERVDVDMTMLAGVGHSAFSASTVIDFSALAGLEQGAWFAVRVNAENNGGATYASSWYYAKYKYDSIPPEAPSDLKAVDAMSGGCITLSFNMPPVDVYYTSVYRSTDPNADPYTLESIGETASGSFSDTGLTDGVRYYYWFRSVDRAGNISAPAGVVSAVPTSVFSIEFKSVMTDVAVPAAEKPIKITVNFTNNGPAKANGTLVLKVNTGAEILTVASKEFSGLQAGNHSYTFDFTVPQNATGLVFTAEACAKDIVTSEFAVNHAPRPVITAKASVDSSDTETYGAELSTDIDEGETENLTFVWDMGDGTIRNGKSITYRYLTPGDYTITLTAIDQRGASSSVKKSVKVIDRRPDLLIKSIAVYRMGATDGEYTLADNDNVIKENDSVRIDATVSNSASAFGVVPADMSFLVGFYLNGVYRGYQTVSGGVTVGGEKVVSFTYTAETGAQIIKIVANDLLDTLKESNKQNNSKTESYNAKQTDFAEIALTSGDWKNATTLDKTAKLTSEEKIIYSANVANSGKAGAKFNVSLYIDGVLKDTISVNLTAGASRVVNFYVAPTAGRHSVIIAADDPLLVETDSSDNSVSFETSAFTVNKAEIATELNVEYPTGMTGGRIAQGGTLTLTATLTPNADIAKAVNVRFYIDGTIIKTVKVPADTLKNGIPYSTGITAKWVVSDGVHSISVVTDSDLAVLETATEDSKESINITVIKPDLWLSDVSWAPADTVEWGNSASFLVRVSNRSVATLYQPYILKLWANKLDSDGSPTKWVVVNSGNYNGIQGNSTSVQILNWHPSSSGSWRLMITLEKGNGADFDTTYYAPLDWSTADTDFGSYLYSYEFTVTDGLTLNVNPNKKGEDEDFGANIFVGSSYAIDVTGEMSLASKPNTLLTSVNDGAMISVRLEYNSDSSIYREAVLTDRGTGKFTGAILTEGLESGMYTLTFFAQGASYVAKYDTQIMFIDDIVGNISTPMDSYFAGEMVVISGNAGVGNTPYTGTIVLDMNLSPYYGDKLPDGAEVNGEVPDQYESFYRGEKIIFLTADENGNFSYSFKATNREAGKWSINAYAFEKLFGSGIKGSDITIYGMETKPTATTVTAAKNTDFTTKINLYNSAWDGDDGALTGVSAVLLNGNDYDGITAILDYSTVKSTLPAGEYFPVTINFFTDEDCADTAEYVIQFSSIEGASTTATVKLSMRPGVPKLYADSKAITAAANPGTTVTKTVTVTNKGIATMKNIVVESGSLSFIRAGEPNKTTLAPGESLSFNVIMAPTSSVQYGKYQDTITVTNGVVSLSIPVGLEVTALEYGSAQFKVSDDFGENVSGAIITLYGRDPYIQYVNGKENIYYLNYSLTTDETGIASIYDKPIGVYDFTVSASGKQTYTGEFTIMPMTQPVYEEVVLTTNPVEISWTVTETTIVDEYEIELTVDLGVKIPEPKLGSTMPWFTIAKNMQSAGVLETKIVNNSLVDVIDAVAVIDGNVSGISVVGGGYIGTIPAMSNATVQLLVQPGFYELPTYAGSDPTKLKVALRVTGSYVSFDEDTGLPVYPAKTTQVRVPIYNPGKQKVNMEVVTSNGKKEEMELQMPDDSELEELDYFIYQNETGERIKKDESASGGVYEVVKLSLSQTASLERQAFDAELKITNNYPNYNLENLTTEVVIQYTDPVTKEVSFITDNVYIIQTYGASSSSISSGATYTGKWKIIPGIGMGGESGRTYQVFARITYTVNGKLVTTSTDPVEINVNPQPRLTVDYYLPHKIYPNSSFRLGVSVTNEGSGTAKNVILDSSQLDIVSNTSGLKSEWEIVSSSFGSYNANSFRLVLGDIYGVNNGLADDGSDLPNMVWGYFTILWKIPELQEDYLKDVYGVINDFTATITHKPYEGVELDSLIGDVNTHIVARDSVKILDDTSGEYIDSMSVIVGTNGLPESIRNTETNVSVKVFVPEGLSGNKSGEDSYIFTAPINTADLSDDNKALRYQILMLGETKDFAKENISAVYRYSSADYSGEPVTLSFSNYWKDTYTVDGEEKDLLYVVDEILRDSDGNILPRYYKVVYGSATAVTEIKTSKITYLFKEDKLERSAVFYDTGKFHDEDDTVPLGVQTTVYNSGKNPESVMVYLYRAPVISGKVGNFSLVDKKSVTVNSYNTQFVYFYIDLYANAEMAAGVYEFRAGTSQNPEMYSVSTQAVINSLPTANAGVDFNATVNKTVVFDGSRSYDSDGQIKSFLWEFGDGSSGWGIAPTHVYTASGTYIATLTVTDDNGTENALNTKGYNGEGMPTDSYAIHNVMVTVNDDRPDLIIVPEILTESIGKGLEITVDGQPVSKTNTVDSGEEIVIYARIMNDKPENPIPSSFIVSLYKDDVYLGYQKITSVYEKTYEIAGESRTVQCADVRLTDIATDNQSHVYTIRANDVSIAFEEADMFNNQRSAIVYGASGRTVFPNIGITEVTFEGKSLVNGATAVRGMSIASGKSIAFNITLKNSGNDATGEFPLTARINGKWAASENVPSIAAGSTVTVTMSFVPDEGDSQVIIFTADGPYPRTLDTDRTDNTWTYNAGTITFEKADLTVEEIDLSVDGSDAVITAIVTNIGTAAAENSSTVTYYADERYLGATLVGKILAGESKEVKYTWKNYEAANRITAVCDAMSVVDETNELNNTYTDSATDGNVLEARAMPALKVTKMVTSGDATYGADMQTKITIKNIGNGESVGAFKVALFAQGILVGETVINRSILPNAVAETTINWTANVLPTGQYEITAILDSEYNIVMSSRSGVRYDETLTVSDGISIFIENDAAYLTQNGDNRVRVRLIRSDGKANNDSAVVKVMIAGTGIISTATYDTSTDRYIAQVDLSTVSLGDHGIVATADFLGLTDVCTFTAKVVPAISVTVNTDFAVYKTGDTVTVSGTTVGLSDGDNIEISITGEQIWKYTAQVGSDGNYIRKIVLPANAGGGMRVSATAKNAGADRTASTNIYVYGAYFTSSNAVEVTAGDTVTVKGAVENIGYIDMRNVILSGSSRSSDAQNTVLPTLKFMSGGHAFVLDEKKTDLLEAVTEGISINGSGIDYNSLDATMQIDATGCAVGDYEIILTVTCNTDKGIYTQNKIISVKVLTPKAIMDITNLNLANDADDILDSDTNPLEVKTSAAPGEYKTFSYRVVNLGTGNLTGLKAELVDKNGCSVPWASVVTVGGVPSDDALTTTVYPYFKGYNIGTAEGAARISVTFAPEDSVFASKYELTLIVSADDVETVNIPMTVYVSAHAIGTKVVKVVTVDGSVVTDGKVTLYGPVSSEYSTQPIEPKSYTGEISGAVTVGSNLSSGGTVQFTNIPSGTYNISVTGNGLIAVTGTIEVLPIIDMIPEKIVVEQQLFVIKSSSSTEKRIDSFTSKNDAYDDAMYKLEFGGAYESEKPDILPDYPIDEMEITYNNGRISSRLAIMNSDMVTGNKAHNVNNVTIRINSRDIPAQYIKFRSGEGLTDVLNVGTLTPQQTFDFVWNLDLSALYIDAVVEKDGVNYTLTLPDGYSWNNYYSVWDRENTLIDDRGYLTKHLYNKVSISEDGRVLTVTPTATDIGEPDGRVPLYTGSVPKLYKFDIIIEGTSALEFADGSITEMKKITRTIPVQVDFIPNGYYLDDNCESMYTTERLEGAFSTGSNSRSKIYSKKFLSNSGASSTTKQSTKNDDGFQVGFSQDIVTSSEYSKLTVEFENPSNVESIEELEFTVIISDMMPDESGKISSGAQIMNSEFYVAPSIVKSKGVKGWDNLSEQEILGKFSTSNGINVGTLLAGGGFQLDFELEPISQLYSNDMFTYLIDYGYMTADEAVEIANTLRKSSGTSYAWVEYSFKRQGRTFSGSTSPVMQKIELPADLTSYEEVFQLDPDSGVHYAAIVITNSGFGTSDEIVLSPPDIPSLNGARYRLSSYHTGSMDDFPSGDATPQELAQWYQGWENNPVPEEIKLAPIASGESIYIIYKINVIGKADDGIPPTLPINPASIELPRPKKEVIVDFGPVTKINGRPVGRCTPDENDGENAANPARIADLIDEIADSLSMLMYSTVADYGTRVEDAYTNAKLMQAAKVVVGVQRYLSYIATVASNIIGKMDAHYTKKPELDVIDEELKKKADSNNILDVFTKGSLLIGGAFYVADDIFGQTQPLLNSIKTGAAKESQVNENLNRIKRLGNLKPTKKVYAELSSALSSVDTQITELCNKVELARSVYHRVVTQVGAGVEKLPTIESYINGQREIWSDLKGEINTLCKEISASVRNLYDVAIKYRQEDIDYVLNYNEPIKKLLVASETINRLAEAINNLDKTMSVVACHIVINHHLRGDYEKDVNQLIKDYNLDLSVETLKAAYANEDINDNYLAKLYPDQAKGLKAITELYGAKESFKSVKEKTENFGKALGEASTQGVGAIIKVLANEGADLASEFEITKDAAEFVSNTMKLIQLLNEEDAMTQAMGAFGDATLSLVHKTYEAVRADNTTGALSKSSSLIVELRKLINEAIKKSNQKSPGAFKPLTTDDEKQIAEYLVKYLNVMRAKYPRSEQTDSNWMKAHVSGVMAALFEQVYVAALTEQATPEAFLKFMKNADKVDTKKTLNSYIGSTLQKKVFRDVRVSASAKLEEAQAIVRRYSDKLLKNSSYPAKEIIRYLEDMAQKMGASSNIEQSVTRRYKDLDIWQLDSVSETSLEIRTNYKISYRDYQKAMLNFDVLNAENSMLVVDYMTAGIYDLIVRSAISMVVMSPDAIASTIATSALATWDSLADIVFNKLDEAWKTRSIMTANQIAELSMLMGATVMKEADIATAIYDLIAALDKAIVFDPPLDTELVTYSVKDVVIPEGEGKGTGEVLVTFRNDGDKTVAISPSVSIYTSAGKVAAADFDANSILIPAGKTAEFIGTFTVNRSMLLDSTGYTAVLSYSASEPSTVSIAAEQGPFVLHFFAGTERQINTMRNKVSAGTIASGWVTGEDILTGSITVKEGQSLRIFATAPANNGLKVKVISPSGEVVAAQSFINEGDYAIISNCEAGTYTVSVTAPENFDGRITVEGIVSSFDKAITAVDFENESVINCNNVADDGTYFTTISVGVSESAGINGGIVDATLDFDSDYISATLVGFDDGLLNAGGAINGGFVIKANPDTPQGVYTGTLKVYFDANLCDPVLLSLASSGDDADSWHIVGDKVVYTGYVTTVVDLAVLGAPEFSVADGEEDGTVKVTGNATGATFVILTYEYDVEEQEDGENYTYTSSKIAAIFNPDKSGNFSITIAKPNVDSRISATAVNSAGGTSKGAVNAVDGYTEPEEENEKFAETFTNVTAIQVEGRRDITVTVAGTVNTGLTVAGDILYRVTDDAPSTNYSSNTEFNTDGWVNVGAVSSFTVKNVRNGQYVEVVQVASENIYEPDEDGNMTVTGVKYTAVRYGSVAVNVEEVKGYTVSGTMISDNVKANATGAILVLTNSADSTITYTANVNVSDGLATYAFNDVISGTYILSLDTGSTIKIVADSILVSVNNTDTIADITIYATYTAGDINDDGCVDNRDLVRLFQYLSDWDVYVNKAALDVNDDGYVDNRDLVRLFQYLSDWDVKIY